MRHRLPLLLAVATFVALPLSADSQEAAPGPPVAEEKDWLEFYYENPRPERFVGQMKQWAADGTLDNDHAKPALIAFTSQLIRQNRERLREWHEALAGLTPGQMQVFRTAMLFSRTEEADTIMREAFGKAYDEQKRETQKILEMPLDKQDTMDMLWGFFYATGAEAAIRRIVVSFRFRDAPDDPEGVEIPKGYVPYYKALPQFAFDSLLANAERHPRVVEILREMLKEDGLLEPEREGVRGVLSEIDPKSVPPEPPATKKA